MEMPPLHFDDSAAQQKRAKMKTLAFGWGFRTFVETGTSEGYTSAAMADVVDRVFTIEQNDAKYMAASMSLLYEPKVTILHGDSAVVLERLVRVLHPSPALFFLDAHYSENDGVPASTPILEELAHVLYHRTEYQDAILIDDAPLFGVPPYPSLDDVTGLVHAFVQASSALPDGQRHRVDVWHDMIRILPL